jgi:hypothetical protein
MLEVNGEIEKMVELLGAARTEMVRQLAVAMASPQDEHFPKFPAYSEKEIPRGRIASAFRRTWVAEPASPARHLLN